MHYFMEVLILEKKLVCLPVGFLFCFLVFDFCRFCMVIRFFIPATTANDLRHRRIFYLRFYPLHLFTYLNSWERASIFPFECSVLNKGSTGTIFITSLVWRCFTSDICTNHQCYDGNLFNMCFYRWYKRMAEITYNLHQ